MWVSYGVARRFKRLPLYCWPASPESPEYGSFLKREPLWDQDDKWIILCGSLLVSSREYKEVMLSTTSNTCAIFHHGLVGPLDGQ